MKPIVFLVPAAVLAAAVLRATVTETPGGGKPVVRVFDGARLHPVASAVVDDGVLVVVDGKIKAAGARGAVVIPEGAEVIDCRGKVIIPGLVCTHSHIGGPSGGDAAKLPDRDLGMETMVEVLEGKRVVHHHTHRADDILSVLRLREEFGFKVVLHHVSEAWKVADEIAAAGAGCSIILLDSPGGKLEARDFDLRNGAELEKRGVVTAVHTDDPVTDSRWLLRSAALAVRGGMSREKALESVTLAGARLLGLEGRTGSLEAGKDADFAVLTGDPLSVYSRVEETWVEGKKVFDLEKAEDRLMAEGGRGAGDTEISTTCCFSK